MVHRSVLPLFELASFGKLHHRYLPIGFRLSCPRTLLSVIDFTTYFGARSGFRSVVHWSVPLVWFYQFMFVSFLFCLYYSTEKRFVNRFFKKNFKIFFHTNSPLRMRGAVFFQSFLTGAFHRDVELAGHGGKKGFLPFLVLLFGGAVEGAVELKQVAPRFAQQREHLFETHAHGILCLLQ